MTFRREPVTAQHPRCDIPFAGSLGRVKDGAQAQGRAAPTSAASRQGFLLPPAPAGRPHSLGHGRERTQHDGATGLGSPAVPVVSSPACVSGTWEPQGKGERQ